NGRCAIRVFQTKRTPHTSEQYCECPDNSEHAFLPATMTHPSGLECSRCEARGFRNARHLAENCRDRRTHSSCNGKLARLGRTSCCILWRSRRGVDLTTYRRTRGRT